MGRTKWTAFEKSKGGKALRKQLATKAARGAPVGNTVSFEKKGNFFKIFN